MFAFVLEGAPSLVGVVVDLAPPPGEDTWHQALATSRSQE